MSSTRDQVRAALLIVAVVMTAATFAGFAFGATSPEPGRRRAAAPLLLQSATFTVQPARECDHPLPVRQANSQSSARQGV